MKIKKNKVKSKNAGYPRFKKKHVCKNSYTTNLANIERPNLYLTGNMLKLPKIKEPVKLKTHRKIREGGVLKNVTVTLEPDGKWYFSLVFEYPETVVTPKTNLEKHIGLDMSLPSLYIDSNGNRADYSKPYRTLENRIRCEQIKLSRKKKNSNNYIKQRVKLAKLHAKAKHQRSDRLHKLSCRLTDNYDIISIETLDMSAMARALNFGKSVSDNGWGGFVRMLEYKSRRKGVALVKVDKWFPSSKKCCQCGHIHKELKLADREYICPACGNAIDRDQQAAINIDIEGMQIFLTSNPTGDSLDPYDGGSGNAKALPSIYDSDVRKPHNHHISSVRQEKARLLVAG